MPHVGTTKGGLAPRDGLWLSIAVILHAGLLLVPYSQTPPDRRLSAPALVIELNDLALAVQPFVDQEPVTDPDPDQVRIPPEPEPEISEPEPPPVPLAELTIPDETERPPQSKPTEEPDTTVTTAVLLQDAAERKWRVPEQNSRRLLGEFVPQDVPPNWKAGIRLDDNLFDGMTVPRQVEVVDRWNSPDGTYNVVVNMPNGETLCGRGQAWDPMRPLVEHVVQFTTCGGGHKKTFEWPDRFRRNVDNSAIANSTTN